MKQGAKTSEMKPNKEKERKQKKKKMCQEKVKLTSVYGFMCMQIHIMLEPL